MPQNEKNKYKLIGNNLFSLDYKEFYKSEVGPRQESKHVFVRHVDFKKLNQFSLNILEIGFGPGTNFFELLQTLEEKKNKKYINYFAYEKNPIDEKTIHKYLKKLNFNKKNIKIFLDSYSPVEKSLIVINFFHLKVNLFFFYGDFLDFVESLSFKIDYFFLDPFSPRVNQEAWSIKIFQSIKKLSHKKTVILTYSVAKDVQENLLSINFKIDLQTGIGKKKNNLLATGINLDSIVPIKNKKIVIIGAGVSGILCAYFLSLSGCEVTLVDSNSEVMSEASSVPIALVRQYFAPKDNVYNQFLFSSYLFASNFYKYLKKKNLNTGIKKHDSIFIPSKNFKFGDFFGKILREKKFVTFSNADFLDEHHFILKNNFSIKTQSFREMISNYLKENVNFQFGVEIKKIKFKAQKYRLFDQDRLITKADAVIYSGGFKSSESVLENSKILKPSIGQQDYIKSFDNFSMPYLGDMYLNKLNAKKFIIGSTYHDGVTDNRFQDSDSQILLDKTNKYFSGIELKKIGSWISTRSITPDRRPLFGEIKPNFFVSTGLGSSGFTISPFMAFLVAKKILGIDLFKLNQFSKIDITRFVSN